ncbi:MAG: protein phosphatase 2C domain-containing protein [Chloroflexota bacterium]
MTNHASGASHNHPNRIVAKPYSSEQVGGMLIAGARHQEGSQDMIWPANKPDFHLDLYRNERPKGEAAKLQESLLPLTGRLYIMADGVSLCADGQAASRLAVQTLAKTFYQKPNPDAVAAETDQERQERLEKAVYVANEELSLWDNKFFCWRTDEHSDGKSVTLGKAEAQKYKDREHQIVRCPTCGKPMIGLQATLTALHLHGDKALLISVGDSWVFRIPGASSRGQEAIQLFEPEPNQFLGMIGGQIPNLQRREISVTPGDIFVLCGDGVVDILEHRYPDDWRYQLAQFMQRDALEHAVPQMLEQLHEYRMGYADQGQAEGISDDIGLIAVAIPPQSQLRETTKEARDVLETLQSIRRGPGVGINFDEHLKPVESYLFHGSDPAILQGYKEILVEQGILSSSNEAEHDDVTIPRGHKRTSTLAAQDANRPSMATEPVQEKSAKSSPGTEPTRRVRGSEPPGTSPFRSKSSTASQPVSNQPTPRRPEAKQSEPKRSERRKSATEPSTGNRNLATPMADDLMERAERYLENGRIEDAGRTLEQLAGAYRQSKRAQKLRAWWAIQVITKQAQEGYVEQALTTAGSWERELRWLESPRVDQLRAVLSTVILFSQARDQERDVGREYGKLRQLFDRDIGLNPGFSLEEIVTRVLHAWELPSTQRPRYRTTPLMRTKEQIKPTDLNPDDPANQSQPPQSRPVNVTSKPEKQPPIHGDGKKSDTRLSSPVDGNSLEGPFNSALVNELVRHLQETNILPPGQHNLIRELNTSTTRRESLEDLTNRLVEVEQYAGEGRWKLVFEQLWYLEIYSDQNTLHDVINYATQAYKDRWIDHVLTLNSISNKTTTDSWVDQFIQTNPIVTQIQQIHKDTIQNAQPFWDTHNRASSDFANPTYLAIAAGQIVRLELPRGRYHTERKKQFEKLKRSYLELANKEINAYNGTHEWTELLQYALTDIDNALQTTPDPSLKSSLKKLKRNLCQIELTHAITQIDEWLSDPNESANLMTSAQMQRRIKDHRHSQEPSAQATAAVFRAILMLRGGTLQRNYPKAIDELIYILTLPYLPTEVYSRIARRIVKIISYWQEDSRANINDWWSRRENRIVDIQHKLTQLQNAAQLPHSTREILRVVDVPLSREERQEQRTLLIPAYTVRRLSTAAVVIVMLLLGNSFRAQFPTFNIPSFLPASPAEIAEDTNTPSNHINPEEITESETSIPAQVTDPSMETPDPKKKETQSVEEPTTGAATDGVTDIPNPEPLQDNENAPTIQSPSPTLSPALAPSELAPTRESVTDEIKPERQNLPVNAVYIKERPWEARLIGRGLPARFKVNKIYLASTGRSQDIPIEVIDGEPIADGDGQFDILVEIPPYGQDDEPIQSGQYHFVLHHTNQLFGTTQLTTQPIDFVQSNAALSKAATEGLFYNVIDPPFELVRIGIDFATIKRIYNSQEQIGFSGAIDLIDDTISAMNLAKISEIDVNDTVFDNTLIVGLLPPDPLFLVVGQVYNFEIAQASGDLALAQFDLMLPGSLSGHTVTVSGSVYASVQDTTIPNGSWFWILATISDLEEAIWNCREDWLSRGNELNSTIDNQCHQQNVLISGSQSFYVENPIVIANVVEVESSLSFDVLYDSWNPVDGPQWIYSHLAYLDVLNLFESDQIASALIYGSWNFLRQTIQPSIIFQRDETGLYKRSR